MRRGTLLVFSLVVLAGAQPSGVEHSFEEHRQLHWTGSCVVRDVDTPCHPVHYRRSFYEVGADGASDFDVVEAVNHSGWAVSRIKRSWRPWWVLPLKRTDIGTVQRSDPNRFVVIDHQRRIYQMSDHAASHGTPIWKADDSSCTRAASHYLYLERRVPTQKVVAGYPTVAYTGRDDQGAEYEILFAPTLGCQEMRYVRVLKGFLGMVTSKDEMEVISFVTGPPDPALFSIPADYRRVASILELDSR